MTPSTEQMFLTLDGGIEVKKNEIDQENKQV